MNLNVSLRAQNIGEFTDKYLACVEFLNKQAGRILTVSKMESEVFKAHLSLEPREKFKYQLFGTLAREKTSKLLNLKKNNLSNIILRLEKKGILKRDVDNTFELSPNLKRAIDNFEQGKELILTIKITK